MIDLPFARNWGDQVPPYTVRWLSATPAEIQELYSGIMAREHNYLAISGGGANGAFGAGLLTGWTAAGTRPEFTIVTGISTGALTAPLAFLGPDYDSSLKEIFTQHRTKDLIKKRNLISTLMGNSAADSRPLQGLIGRYMDEKMMQAIAEEHHRGRRLLIGTTNLDAGRPVIWDIGHIADSGNPGALDLIRKVLLASASIPVIFPPVLLPVESDGKIFDEMHVDGGTTTQVFLFPMSIDWKLVGEKLLVQGRPNIYLVRNAKLAPSWRAVNPRIVPIADRAISSLIRTQGIGDLYRIYLRAQRDGLNYNLAFIPETFTAASMETFDREYMNTLFDLGYEMALAGYPWKKAPPGYSPD